MSTKDNITPESDEGAQSEADSENTGAAESSEAEKPVALNLPKAARTVDALPPYMMPPSMGQAAILASLQQQHAWNAPVPPPEAAERFEKICPGSFNRMLRMAEKEQDNQIDLSQKQLAIAKKTGEEQVVLATRAQDYLATDTKRGHYLGALISILAMVGAGVAAIFHMTALGIAFLGVPVMTVAMAFINSHKENKAKSKDPEPSNDSEVQDKKENSDKPKE